jgi:hypothetical protein
MDYAIKRFHMGLSSMESRAVSRPVRIALQLLIGLSLAGGGYMAGHWQAAASQQHAHHRPSAADIARVSALHAGRNTAIQVPHVCRQGAFLDASSIINSVAEIQKVLPADSPRLMRVELDSILFTALKQAHGEVHCIAGALSFGYDHSFAASIQRGVDLARLRGLPPEVGQIGEAVIQTLKQNRVLDKPLGAAN